MKWIRHSKARSQVAMWALKNKDKDQPFRLKEICHYAGRENDRHVDKGYLEPIEQLLSVEMAHKITSELVEKGLLIPKISSTKVEEFHPRIDGNEKEWKGMVGAKNTAFHVIKLFLKWIWSKLANVSLWLITVISAAAVKDIFFS